MAYPLPNNTINSTYDLVMYVNNITTVDGNGMIGVMLLLLMFFVVFISLKNYPMDRAFATASFVCFLASVFLVYLGLIKFWYALLCILLTAIALVMLYVNNQEIIP